MSETVTAAEYARLLRALTTADAEWAEAEEGRNGRVNGLAPSARGGVMSGYFRRRRRAWDDLTAAIERGSGLPPGAIAMAHETWLNEEYPPAKAAP